MTWLYFLFLQFQAAHREGATKHCGGWGRSPAWSLVLSLSVIEGNSPRYGGSPAEDLRRIAQLAAARSSVWYSLWNRASLPHMPGYGWSTVSPVPSSVERLSSPSPTLQCHLALCVEFAPWDLGTLQAAPWEYVHWIPSRRELTWLRRRMILCLPWLRTFRFCCCAWFLPQDLFLKKIRAKQDIAPILLWWWRTEIETKLTCYCLLSRFAQFPGNKNRICESQVQSFLPDGQTKMKTICGFSKHWLLLGNNRVLQQEYASSCHSELLAYSKKLMQMEFFLT